ncbi:MAG: MFS transporter [Rhodospirillales bacterium]|nr:MFS transporter [Rhodospirillales bacterium]
MTSRAAETPRRGALLAWWLYDWAGSAFNTIVVTFVFPTYFVRAVAADPVTGTAAWAGAQSAAGLAIALLAAPLGAIADRGGHGRAFLGAAVTVLVAATGALWLVRPHSGDAALALWLAALATIAFEIGFVFYNAMLPALAPVGRVGRVSGIGWAMGYAGGISCLGICLGVFILPASPPFGLGAAAAEPVRACALLAAAWIALFAWPVLAFGPTSAHRVGWSIALRDGFRVLGDALRRAARDRVMRRFLIARMLYTDGLTTLFAFGGIFAAGSFGVGARGVLVLGIALNVTAGIGAVAFGLIEDRVGDRRTALIALGALSLLGAAVLAVRGVAWFWVLALLLGVFVGPAQSASRTLMARLAPADARNAGFGLYALSGRVTGFVGPAALGAVTALAHSQRAGMAVIVALLATGWALLLRTPIPATIA